jgi:hypothetical protein
VCCIYYKYYNSLESLTYVFEMLDLMLPPLDVVLFVQLPKLAISSFVMTWCVCRVGGEESYIFMYVGIF